MDTVILFYRYYECFRRILDVNTATQSRRIGCGCPRDDLSLGVAIHDKDHYKISYTFLHTQDANKSNRRMAKDVIHERMRQGDVVLVSKAMVKELGFFNAVVVALISSDRNMPKWFLNFVKEKMNGWL